MYMGCRYETRMDRIRIEGIGAEVQKFKDKVR